LGSSIPPGQTNSGTAKRSFRNACPNRGWKCRECDALFAKVEDAEACCGEPRLRLYIGE
jgi:hypothetical protein